jgi:hypothetical protein
MKKGVKATKVVKAAKYECLLRSRLFWIIIHPAISFSLFFALYSLSVLLMAGQYAMYGVIGLIASFFIPFVAHNAFFMSLYGFLPESLQNSQFLISSYAIFSYVAVFVYYAPYILFLSFVKKMNKRTLYICGIIIVAMMLVTLNGFINGSALMNPSVKHDLKIQQDLIDKVDAIGLESIETLNESHCDNIISEVKETTSSYVDEYTANKWYNACKSYVRGNLLGISACMIYDGKTYDEKAVRVTDDNVCEQNLVRYELTNNCITNSSNASACITEYAIQYGDLFFCDALGIYGVDQVNSCRISLDPGAGLYQTDGYIYESPISQQG